MGQTYSRTHHAQVPRCSEDVYTPYLLFATFIYIYISFTGACTHTQIHFQSASPVRADASSLSLSSHFSAYNGAWQAAAPGLARKMNGPADWPPSQRNAIHSHHP